MYLTNSELVVEVADGADVAVIEESADGVVNSPPWEFDELVHEARRATATSSPPMANWFLFDTGGSGFDYPTLEQYA